MGGICSSTPQPCRRDDCFWESDSSDDEYEQRLSGGTPGFKTNPIVSAQRHDSVLEHTFGSEIGLPFSALPTPRNMRSPSARRTSCTFAADRLKHTTHDSGRARANRDLAVTGWVSETSKPRLSDSQQSYIPSTPYVLSAQTISPVHCQPFVGLELRKALDPLASFTTPCSALPSTSTSDPAHARPITESNIQRPPLVFPFAYSITHASYPVDAIRSMSPDMDSIQSPIGDASPYAVSASAHTSQSVEQSTELGTLEALTSFTPVHIANTSKFHAPLQTLAGLKDRSARPVDAQAVQERRFGKADDKKDVDSRVKANETNSGILTDESMPPPKLTAAEVLIAQGRFIKPCLSDNGQHATIRVSSTPPELLGNVGIRDWLLPN